MSNQTFLRAAANIVARNASHAELRKFIRKCLRENRHAFSAYGPDWALHYRINERAEYRARIDEVQENGKIGYVKSGMDCDCSQYHYSMILDAPTSMMEVQRDENRRNEYLDGPEHRYFVKPSEIDPEDDFSRDLALEAFEDGHPHIVYAR